MHLICKRCGNEWDTKKHRGNKKPKQCTYCKSPSWDKPYHEKKPKEDGPEIIKMKCTACSKDFEEGESVFRAQEGKNIGGHFVFTEKLQQGLYCDKCMVAPEQLPFLADKRGS